MKLTNELLERWRELVPLLLERWRESGIDPRDTPDVRALIDEILRLRVEAPKGFEMGDVVKLKSGSVPLTVVLQYPQRGADSVELCRCMFFADGKFGETMIAAAALVKVEAEA